MTDQTAGIGHNAPPAIEEFRERVAELVTVADQWLDKVPEILDEETAGKASDFVTQLRAEYKAAEDQRKAEKQPHTDAGKRVDEQYKPLTTRLTVAGDAIKKKLTGWLQKKQAAEDAARRQREEAARKAQEEADRFAAEAAKANSIDAQIAADEARERAEAAQKDAETERHAQTKGDFGRTTTLRTTYRGEIVTAGQALAYYAHDSLILDALKKAIARDIRAGTRAIPGVKIIQEQKAA